jgi:putative heme transporter
MPQARLAASAVTGGLAWARRHRGAILRLTVELAVVGLAILLLTRQRASLAGLGEQLGHLRWGWVTVAIGAEAASVVALAALQNWLLGIGGVRPSLGSMVRITLASNAIALSLPAGVALSEGYAFQQYRRKGADGSLAAWAELSAGAWSVASLAGLVVAGLLIAGSKGPTVVLRLLAVVVFAGATGAALLFGVPRELSRWLTWMLAHGRRIVPEKLRPALARAERSVEAMRSLHPSALTWATAGGFATLNWLGDCGCLIAAFLAVGGSVPWRGMLLAYAGARLLAELPITPGGVGIVEGGLVLTLVAYGGSPVSSTAAVLVYRSISFWLLILVGWLAWALRDRRSTAR